MTRARHPDEFLEYMVRNADLLARRAIIVGARDTVGDPIGEPEFDSACQELVAWADGHRPELSDEDVVILERRICERSGLGPPTGAPCSGRSRYTGALSAHFAETMDSLQ